MGFLKKIGMSAAVSVLFIACGGDNSTKANENKPSGPQSNADYEVDDFEDLPNCTSKKEGATGFVVEVGEGYVCKDGDWVRDDDAVDVEKPNSSQKGGSSSSGKKDDEDSDSSAKSSESVEISSDSNGGSAALRKCAADFDGKYMGYEGSTYQCYEGFWNPVENPPEDTETQVICLKTEDPNAPLYCYLDTAIWSSSSYEADAEDFTNRDPVKITGGSIEGVAQKGPYLQGSSYRIIPLDGKTLLPVGDTLNESFNNSSGTYTFCDLEMPSQFAMIEANGYYRSELTGNKSNLQMTIGAIVDVQKGANINMLTNLEYERVKYLVQNEGYNIAGAKKRALTEVLAAFHIDADAAVDAEGNKLSAELLDITKDGVANGALLAVSILIQGAITNTEFDVKSMMKDFRDDIKEDGIWTGKSARTIIADFAFVADSAKKFAEYRKNVESWKLSQEVPIFEQYLNDFWASEYGIGKCTEDRFGTIKKNQNAISVHKEKYFLCDTLYYSVKFGNSGFKTSWDSYVQKFYYWRGVDEFERNTRNQVCNVEGLIIPGNIDKDQYYICAKESYNMEWREATGVEVDKYYTECTADGKLNRFSDGKLYKCSNDEFVEASALDSALGTGCVSYLESKIMEFENVVKTYRCSNGFWISTGEWALGNCSKDGSISAMASYTSFVYSGENAVENYVCDADSFRVAVHNDSLLDFACTSYGEGVKEEKKENEKNECALRTVLTTSECNSSSWKITVDASLWNNSGCNISYGKLEDSRDGQMYKTVKIGSQTWMAENLNYSPRSVSGTYSWSGCYNNSADSCAKYGHLYTWDVAKKVCPSGWHLPTMSEYEALMGSVGDSSVAGVKLGAISDNGADVYGFSALRAGYRPGDVSGFYYSGEVAIFWLAGECNVDGRAYSYNLSGGEYDGSSCSRKSRAFSVRCIQD